MRNGVWKCANGWGHCVSCLPISRSWGGEAPLYADYLVMGTFIWARKMSPFALVEPDDPVHAWMNRCLDLYDGAARQGPGFDW